MSSASFDYMLDPPDYPEHVCSDCGEPTDGRYTAPDYSVGYDPLRKGPIVCASCHEQYNPEL